MKDFCSNCGDHLSGSFEKSTEKAIREFEDDRSVDIDLHTLSEEETFTHYSATIYQKNGEESGEGVYKALAKRLKRKSNIRNVKVERDSIDWIESM